MDRSLWTGTFSASACPPWRCPVCHKGTLVAIPKAFAFHETTESARAHSDDAFDPEWILYFFTAWAKCSYAECEQKVAIAGKGGVSPEYTGREEGEWEYVDYFEPLYCLPMPHIIDLPKDCPSEVSSELCLAFAAFWSDTSSCANRIRVALERLMDHLGVPKRKRHQGRPGYYDLTLHARIEGYAATEPAIGAQLMALKWLGNAGSHQGVVSAMDLLDAFEILEHALKEVVDGHSAHVAKLAKQLAMKHGK